MNHSNLITAITSLSLLSALPAFAQATKDKETKDKTSPAAKPKVAPINPESLLKLNKDLTTLTKRVLPATVSLVSENGVGAGSGVVVSENGLILTAAHVISSMPGKIIVIFPDGTRKTAKALGADYDRDAAMVQIIEPGKYPSVELTKKEQVNMNQWVVALGHTGGYDATRTPPVRLGRVLSKGEFIITNATVTGGDSGGPLFDTSGKLIGIHSNIGHTLSENRHVSISVFRKQWDELKGGQSTGSKFKTTRQIEQAPDERLVVGINFKDDAKGPLIVSVTPGSPADLAGLKKDDIITKVDDTPVANIDEFLKYTQTKKSGDVITIEYLRLAKPHTTKATLVSYGSIKKKDNNEPADPNANAKKTIYKKIDKALAATLKKGDGKLNLALTQEELDLIGGQAKVQEYVQKRMIQMQTEKAPEEDKKAPEEDKKDQPEDANADAKKAIYKKIDTALAETLKKGNGNLNLELTQEELDLVGGQAKVQEYVQKRMIEMQSGDTPKDAPKKEDNAENKKKESKDDASSINDMTDKELDEYLLKSMADGKLEITPEVLEKIGGLEALKKRIARLNPLATTVVGSDIKDEHRASVIKALQPVAQKCAGSTATILIDGKQVALGTIVSADGSILTKDTETAKGEITVKIGEKIYQAVVVKRFPQRDLALLKIEASNLKALPMLEVEPALGTVLTTVDADNKPLGIGVISVSGRTFKKVGFLGVQSAKHEKGIKVLKAVPGGSAEAAGLKAEDIITTFNGVKVGDLLEFSKLVRSIKAGTKVTVEYLRGGKPESCIVTLEERATRDNVQFDPRLKLAQGKVSAKRGGYPDALQHDIPITPNQCGGPLLDLNGNCIGINVSRAGRTKTYAIPADEIMLLLKDVK